MDDITRQYMGHLVGYEPFRFILPRLLENLKTGYMAELLIPPAKRAVGVTDDTLRGKIAGLVDLEQYVAQLDVEFRREVEAKHPAPQVEAWVDQQPFGRVRTD